MRIDKSKVLVSLGSLLVIIIFILGVSLLIGCSSTKVPCTAKFHKGQVVKVGLETMTVYETDCISRNDTYALRNKEGKIVFFEESLIKE